MGRIKQYSDSNGTYRTNRKINFLEILMADPDTQGHLQSLFKKQMEGEVAKTETDNKDNNDDAIKKLTKILKKYTTEKNKS